MNSTTLKSTLKFVFNIWYILGILPIPKKLEWAMTDMGVVGTSWFENQPILAKNFPRFKLYSKKHTY